MCDKLRHERIFKIHSITTSKLGKNRVYRKNSNKIKRSVDWKVRGG